MITLRDVFSTRNVKDFLLLASGWQKKGVYNWEKEALGVCMGSLAIWLECIENAIWYPSILSFIPSTSSDAIDPDLANQKAYVMSAILITFWSVIFMNFLRMRVSGWISSITALSRTIIPTIKLTQNKGSNPIWLQFLLITHRISSLPLKRR